MGQWFVTAVFLSPLNDWSLLLLSTKPKFTSTYDWFKGLLDWTSVLVQGMDETLNVAHVAMAVRLSGFFHFEVSSKGILLLPTVEVNSIGSDAPGVSRVSLNYPF